MSETASPTRTRDKEDINDRIRSIEQRLENRRVRLRNDTDEAKTAAAATARRWLPIAAAAGAGLAALWLTRRAKASPRVYVPYAADGAVQVNRRGVRWASLLGLASTAYKLGTSPQARLLLAAFRRRAAARRYG
jgi:hypothetical protein